MTRSEYDAKIALARQQKEPFVAIDMKKADDEYIKSIEKLDARRICHAEIQTAWQCRQCRGCQAHNE